MWMKTLEQCKTGLISDLRFFVRLCLEDIFTIAQIKTPLLESARPSICLSPQNIIINTFIIMNVLMMMFLEDSMNTSKCHSIRHQTPKFPTPQKSYATIFLGYSGPYFGPTNTNHTKKYQKITFGVLFIGPRCPWGPIYGS